MTSVPGRMEFKAVVVGADVTVKKAVAFASRAKTPTRRIGERVWVELPFNSSSSNIDVERP